MQQIRTPSKPRWNQAFQRLWTLHWVMAVCFLGIYAIGIVMARLPHEVAFRGSLYNVHKSFGVLVLSLLLLRIFTLLQAFGRKYLKRGPRLTPHWMQSLALHSLMYLLMLVVPISGIVLSDAGGHAIPFFGVTLPNLFAENRSLAAIAHSLHFWLAYTLLVFVGLHLVEQRRFLQKIWRRLVKA